MKTLVIGATGMVGYNIVLQLLEAGSKVCALVRTPENAKKLLPKSVEIFQGDVTKVETLQKAFQDCDVVYHAAGLPEQWFKNPSIFQEVNVQGTRNVMEAASFAQIKRVVYTSTIDVFTGHKDKLYDETSIDPNPRGTHYARSKQDADKIAWQYFKSGMDIVFLHPSGVYGTGPLGSPGPNGFIADLIKGKVPMLLPGGMPIVNSIDCARGHLLAAQNAKAGERFILSDRYLTLVEFASIVKDLENLKKIPSIMPLWFAKLFSGAGELWARISGSPPMLPAGQLHFLQWQAIPDSSKARSQLVWKPIELNKGIKETIAHLRKAGILPKA